MRSKGFPRGAELARKVEVLHAGVAERPQEGVGGGGGEDSRGVGGGELLQGGPQEGLWGAGEGGCRGWSSRADEGGAGFCGIELLLLRDLPGLLGAALS